MDNQEIDILLKNQSLKFEFALRNLDLTEVFCYTPDDLVRENRVLAHLLDWVEKYTEYRDRIRMEREGYLFPPIDPGISPENDWYRFKEWIHGHPLRTKLKEQLLRDYTPQIPEQLTDEEIALEVEKLLDLFAAISVQVDLQGELPARLLYAYLLERLEEDFDILVDGMWHIDGCSGYCPGCFQRPWCEFGSRSCWREDEEAGKMVLIELTQQYVSSSPVSLHLLQIYQAEEDRSFAEFRQNYKDGDNAINPWPFASGDDSSIPF
jgi:hypothetical protein